MAVAPRLSDIQEILLMGPGPSCVPPQVLEAISRPTIGHMDPYFIGLADEVKAMLRTVMGTKNHLTIPMSGTGSAGMETCFVNLLERGDPVLILVNGVFGMRMKDVASRLGAVVDSVEFEWGTPVRLEAVRDRLKDKAYRLVAVVHAETSTGVRNPVAEIGGLLRGSDTLYLVDAVTSLGGIPVCMDEWGVDALYSGTQKCLSCPPGLSPVSFSERALERLADRRTPVPNWYLDISMIMKYWEGNSRVYHHTAPINMIYALYQALVTILDEGLDTVYQRHADAHASLVGGLADLGLELLVDEPYRLPMLNAVVIPAGTDDADLRSRLLSEYKIEIGGGLGPLSGRVWRIGLMGHTARRENVERVLSAMGQLLHRRPGRR
jgi:alanine-glyoxylate transaminase/serine-glyoxylate transaminase/serine-pyruvate transaminase